MSKDGGYKIIDFADNNITSTPIVIPHIYTEINKSYRKVFLISGITLNGTRFSDTFAKVIKNGGQFIIHAYTAIADNKLDEYDIIVQSNDNVSLQIRSVQGGAELDNVFIVKAPEENLRKGVKK